MQQTLPYRVWLVFLFAALTPFLKGLFPTDLQLTFTLIALLAVTAHLLTRADAKDKWHSLDYLLLALGGLYCLAALWGVTPRAAIQVGLNYVLYLCVYWIASRTISTRAHQEWLLKAVALVASGVSLGSVVLASGLIEFPDALYSGRLSGPFQYPNALAGYLLVGLSLSLVLRASARVPRARLLWTVTLFASMAAMTLTVSRTAILLLPGVVLASIWLLPRNGRIPALAGLGAAGLAVGVSIIPMTMSLRDPSLTLLLWFLAGAGMAAAFEGLLVIASGRIKGPWITLGLAVPVAGATLFGVLTQSGTILSRLSAISLGESNLVLRLWTYKDAVTAWWTEAPVLGLGGGGWASVYLRYRSLNFVSKHTHSSLVETLTETGVQGALLLLAVWIVGISLGWQLRKTAPSDESKALWTGAILGLGGLLVHSLFDFDLWYPAISLLVFIILGLFRAGQPTVAQGSQRRRKAIPWAKYGTIALLLMAIGATSTLLMAAGAHSKALRHLNNGEWEDAITDFGRAVRLDPLHPTYHSHYGDFLIQYGSQIRDAKAVALGGTLLERATSLERHNPNYRILLANYLVFAGEKERALGQLEEAVMLDPQSAETYARAANLALELVVESVEASHRENASRYLRRAESVLMQFDRAMESQPTGFASSWPLRASDAINLSKGVFAALSGRASEAQSVLIPLQRSRDAAIKEQAVLWGAGLKRAGGDSSGLPSEERYTSSPDFEQRVARYESVLMQILANPLYR